MPSEANPWRGLASALAGMVAGWSPATRLAMNGHAERLQAMYCGRKTPKLTTYILVFTSPDGAQSINLTEFRNDATIIDDARPALSREWVSIAIGRGNIVCEAEWLGVWDWNGGDPAWTPEE